MMTSNKRKLEPTFKNYLFNPKTIKNIKFNLIFIITISLTLIIKNNIYAELNYVEQEILFVKWGDNEGQISLKRYPNGDYGGGPIMLKTDLQGNIYLKFTPEQNEKIMKFSENGKYIFSLNPGFSYDNFVIDDLERLILVNTQGPNFGDAKIFDENGKYLKDIKIKWSENAREVIYYQNGAIYNNANEKIYEFDDLNKTLARKSQRKQKRTNLKKSIRQESILESSGKGNYINISGLENIEGTISEKRISLKKIKSHLRGTLIKDIDSNDSVYFLVEDIITHGIDANYIIAITDKNGNLLNEIEMKRDLMGYRYITSFQNYIDIDAEGNVYQVWSNKEGIHVTKWAVE